MRNPVCPRSGNCVRGIDSEETERLRWWVPIEAALLYTGVEETLRGKGEPPLLAYHSEDVLMTS